jgi:hypothetical protein
MVTSRRRTGARPVDLEARHSTSKMDAATYVGLPFLPKWRIRSFGTDREQGSPRADGRKRLTSDWHGEAQPAH